MSQNGQPFRQFIGISSYAEKMLLHENSIVRIDPDLPLDRAALVGCGVLTGVGAALRSAGLEAGQTVAVFGCGGVGLSAVMVAKALGARVVAVDISTAALDAARDLGADETSSAATEVRDLTGGGAHVSLDALGRATVATAAIAGLRPRGRHVQVGLLHGDEARAAVPMDLVVARELAVLGSHGMPAVDYPAMLDLVASGALDPERLVTRRIGLADAGAALAAMDGPVPPGITIVEP